MLRISLLTFFLIGFLLIGPAGLTGQEKGRAIIADDFTKNRPKPKLGGKPGGKMRRTYRPASTPEGKSIGGVDNEEVLVGITIWKLEPLRNGRYGSEQYMEDQYVAKRVEADTEFRQGDLLRLSIESPHDGYLYVIDRDWFIDDSSGETNLIFPRRDENNRLEAGRLIDIPAQDQTPFKASPKPNQAGEHLIIIVTSTPISLPVYKKTLPISDAQLMDWKERWGAFIERFEMNGGAGQIRTIAEQQAAAPKGARQLTRDDPTPQTIFLLTPRNSNGLLFNLMLSYVR